MSSRMLKLASAAAVLGVVVLAVTLVDRAPAPAYALEQTVEAMKNIHFLHVVRRDDNGQVKYESWTELGLDGKQLRYRQDSPPDFLVIDDGQTVAAYHNDRDTVVLYDPNDKQWTMGTVSTFLENLSEEGMLLDENIGYRGRPAHRVRWLMANQDCFVDPETKLPIAACGYEISYEDPPEDTFDIVIPDHLSVVDARCSGEPADEPDWLKNIAASEEDWAVAVHAMSKADYAQAAELFANVVKYQPRRNWSWTWLGKAHYQLGQYDLAIYEFSKVIDMLGNQPYCHYLRGSAYAQKGMQDAANEDLHKALQWMILALRYPKAATFFEWADGPYYNATEQQILARMVNRLRIVTGQNFGYDPAASSEENEQAIVAWELWYAESPTINFTPDAELVPVGSNE